MTVGGDDGGGGVMRAEVGRGLQKKRTIVYDLFASAPFFCSLCLLLELLYVRSCSVLGSMSFVFEIKFCARAFNFFSSDFLSLSNFLIKYYRSACLFDNAWPSFDSYRSEKSSMCRQFADILRVEYVRTSRFTTKLKAL